MRQFSLVEQYIKEPCSFRSHIWANKWSSKKQTNTNKQTNKQKPREKRIYPETPKKHHCMNSSCIQNWDRPPLPLCPLAFADVTHPFIPPWPKEGLVYDDCQRMCLFPGHFFCWNVTFNFAWPLVSSLYLQHLDFLLRPFCQEAVLLLPWFTSRSWQAFILCQALTVNLSFISPRRSQPKPYS